MDRHVIFSSFLAALGQLGDPRFRWVFLQGVGLTVLLLMGLYAFAFWGIAWLVPDAVTLPFIGQIGLSDTLVSWGSLLVMLVLSIFLMVPVASAFTGIFLDDVADAVEAKHYPHLPPAPTVGLAENIRESLGFLGVIVIANALALVLYFTPLAPIVFYGLNGFLLGREYFRMIAVRRLGRTEASKAYRRNLFTIWIAGTMMAVPLTVPLLNLVVPILGVATFTHIFHRLNG